MKLEEGQELDIFGKPCMIAIPHGTSDYIDFAVKEQENQMIPASHYQSKDDDVGKQQSCILERLTDSFKNPVYTQHLCFI